MEWFSSVDAVKKLVLFNPSLLMLSTVVVILCCDVSTLLSHFAFSLVKHFVLGNALFQINSLNYNSLNKPECLYIHFKHH